jgi:uncharacterized protein
VSAGDWKELFNAACEGDLPLVEYHVSQGVDINYAHPEFLSTPLVACILARQAHVAQFLLSKGASPTLFSEFDGVTPIQAARNVGLAQVEAQLRELGAQLPPSKTRAKSWLMRIWNRSDT